ncbi:MAG: Ig-like domain-containing protein [bacterium]|nr:Ig-like domain-containing protein [bacterium]
MKKAIFFLVVTFLVLIAFSSFFWLYEVKFKVGRASISAYAFSIDNSYTFITPLRARANGQEKVRISVFILNNQGLGVQGKKVFVGMNTDLNVETIQGLTDSFGKAYFDVSALKPGEYFNEITVDGTPLKQKAHLSFY